MPKLIDLTGQTFNRLTVVRRDTSRKNGTYWICRCSCGNIVSVRAYSITSGSTKSCGCLNIETIHRPKRNYVDITGNRYGDLEVIRYVDSDHNGTRWECKCHACGKTAIITAAWLKSYTSCGCKAKKTASENVKKLHQVTRSSQSNYSILRKEANANNQTTGVRGVTYIKSTGNYVAYITYQKKRYTLCRSKDLEKCKAVRKRAEIAVRSDFEEWLEEYKKEEVENDDL